MTYDANASPVEDRDEAARDRAKVAISEHELKRAAPHREGRPFFRREGPTLPGEGPTFFAREGAGATPSDEGAGLSPSDIPPLPTARPIPGHEHHPGPADQQHGRGQGRRGRQEGRVTADQPTLPVDENPNRATPGWVTSLVSHAAALPFGAMRLALHGVSRAGRRVRRTLHSLEDRGEHVWRDWLGRRRA